MLAIILKILSIIGILILCLLGLVLFLIIAVCFVPIRYVAEGQLLPVKEYSLKVRMSWLFHLIRIYYSYPSPGTIKVKVLFFKVFDSGKETRKKQRKETPEKETEKTIEEVAVPEKGEEPEATVELKEKEETASRKPDVNIETEKPSFINRIKLLFQKIKYTFKELCDKIKSVFLNIKYYYSVVTQEENKQLFLRCKAHIVKIVRTLLPRHAKVNIHFGTGEPDSTGYALGLYYSMLYPVLGKNILVNIEPDFNEKVLEGDFKAKGHLTVFTFLVIVFRVWRDPQLKTFMNLLKREDK